MSIFKKYSWHEINDDIMLINPEFKAVIDEISPSKSFSLYLLEYPYGALILDKGFFQIIDDKNKLEPLYQANLSNEIKEDLGYAGTIPVGMVLENSIETFFLVDNRTIPSSFYTKGNMISLWSVLEGAQSYQQGSLWSISAGSRTICMLPKITDKSCHESLMYRYNLKMNIPQSLSDHWSIFRAIANHDDFPQQWKTKILFFSKKWFQYQHDKKWAGFYQFILKTAWQDSTFKRNQFIFDFAFSVAQKNRNLKPNPYLADTVKHLIGIGTGCVPGFKPATDDVAAPIQGLQKTYIEDYGLKKYHPIIMHLHHFSNKMRDVVYYSLEMPTTIIFSPRSNQASKMVDMRELRHILTTLFSEILRGHLMIEQTPLFHLANDINYNFYHTERDQHNEICNILSLINSDLNFQNELSKWTGFTFPEFSPFFRGCVSVCLK